MKKLSFCSTFLICSWFFIFLACSAPLTPINVDAEGVSIKGYDTVAYFTLKRPVKGKNEFQFEWNNAKWLFASKEHLEMFKGDPEKFAPQYGGY